MHSFVIFIKLIKKIVLVVELIVSKEELHTFFQKNIDLFIYSEPGFNIGGAKLK